MRGIENAHSGLVVNRVDGLYWGGVTVSPFGRGCLSMNAMPLILLVLACLAIAYRFYSTFLAAKVAAFDDARVTPAHRFNDG